MQTGDKVTLKRNIDGFHASPPKYELPEERTFNKGASAEITEVYPSGGGIIRIGNKRVLVANLTEVVD